MIYFLHGNDTRKSRVKLTSLLKSLFLKKPNAGFFKLDSDNFTESKLKELILSQGLFEKKYIVQMDGLFEEKEVTKLLENQLESLNASENIFIFIENKVSKLILKKIEKYAIKVQEFSLKNNQVKSLTTVNENFKIGDFNIFDLATCFGKRDKKNLWVIYQKTKIRAIPSEEVSGIIFWQLKTMFQALFSKTASQAGLKPFVFNKAKSYLKNYSEDELRRISAQLVFFYHNARRSGLELDLALEKFIIEL